MIYIRNNILIILETKDPFLVTCYNHIFKPICSAILLEGFKNLSESGKVVKYYFMIYKGFNIARQSVGSSSLLDVFEVRLLLVHIVVVVGLHFHSFDAGVDRLDHVVQHFQHHFRATDECCLLYVH